MKESDEAVLASLGYKQEFKRAFTAFEACRLFLFFTRIDLIVLKVFGISFSIIGLLPSIA